MAETQHTGRFFIISNVAFQGEVDQSHGWPVRASSLDDAVVKARAWGLNAFHFYVTGDRGAGDMYPFQNVIGCEPREGDRQCVAVLMERTSVHP